MYLGVDVGGTKTLVAVLDDEGVITERVKFPTPEKYNDWLSELSKTLATFNTTDFQAAGLGVPATSLDRSRGIAYEYGNLAWRNTPVQADLEKLTHCPVVVENDAKLAGLSEAMLLKDTFHKVLYITVSTGIGIALVVDEHIDTNIGDGGGRLLQLEYRGKLTPWEDFASGRAIVERYGKKAQDITDEATWKRIAHDLAAGFIELIALTEPDVIVIGGSVGSYFDRYNELLASALKQLETPLLAIPPLRQAQRPEEAVVFGCYDLAKERYGKHA